MSSRTILRLTIAALLAAPAAAALADAPEAPDTSNWKCDACPFNKGYEADATLGAVDPSGANAASGRYSGLDKNRVYVDADAHGDWHDEGGSYASYQLDDLGLDSRSGRIALGADGRYSLALSYTGLPHRVYDTTVTPYAGGGGSLTLPAGWVPAGSTAGMTDLASSLHGVDIGTLRKNYGIDGRWIVGSGWTVFGSAHREDKTGTDILGASFLTQAVQLPVPVDYETDTFEVGAAWANPRMSFRISASDSNFKDNTAALAFQNPYLPLVPSASTGLIALPPDNEARGLSVTGSSLLPWHSNVSLALGYTELKQDQMLLPTSTMAGATSPGSFDGDVKLSHYALTVGSRPIPRLNLHGRVSYDERNDESTPLTIAQVITDSLPGPTVTTPRYDYDRTRFDAGADYRIARWLTAGVAGDRLDVSRTEQVVEHTADGRTYGLLRLTPWNSLAITLKGGAAHRNASGINLAYLPPEENPLLVMFNLADRDRTFFELGATVNPTDTVSLGLQGFWADDEYHRSTLGLQSGRERRVTGTLGWNPAASLSFYADGGYQSQQTLQAGQYSGASPLWQALLQSRYWNGGVGARYTHGKMTVNVDYAHATSGDETGVGQGGVLGAFPDLTSRYDSAGLTLGYALSKDLKVRLRYLYQNYASSDWALDNVGPATVANLLALGAPAQGYNVNLVGLSFTYRFGADAAAAKE
jgi:MtrB/PioB family decaheme-associated outer membrane protein